MSQAVHWNNNLLCVVDIETSGMDPSKHDILQIAVVPLNGDYTPNTKIGHFEALIAPVHEERHVQADAMRVNGLDWHNQKDTCADPYKIVELFDEWFERLRLPFNKHIIPLAHNWPFEHRFLFEMFGPKSMDHYFFQFRDSMAFANTINDIADMRNEQWPFPKTSLKYLCSQLKVINHKEHDALYDCLATAECYGKMIRKYAEWLRT